MVAFNQNNVLICCSIHDSCYPFNARTGHMGTYLLGTIYDVIAPFLLEMGKNVPDWKWSAWNLLRFCLFRISLASLLRILRLFKLIFFPESFTSFLKIPQAWKGYWPWVTSSALYYNAPQPHPIHPPTHLPTHPHPFHPHTTNEDDIS